MFKLTPVSSLKALGLAATLMLAALAAPAAALPPLGAQDYVVEHLMAARIADRIRTNCPTISARLIYAWREAHGLKDWARNQGYSEAEVNTFLKSRAEKDKIYARAEDFLKQNGATDEAGFCALGKAEIAKGSYIGSFIYED